MCITTGLTTSKEYTASILLPARIPGSRYGGRHPTAIRAVDFEPSPFISVNNMSPFDSRKALFRARNRGQTAPLRPGFALAAASGPGARQTPQVHPIPDVCCQSDGPARTTHFHNPLILLDGKLSCRRLECKQNFRRKCPQNRLRTFKLASGVEPKPSPSPNLMSRRNLNPLPIGVLYHGQ